MDTVTKQTPLVSNSVHNFIMVQSLSYLTKLICNMFEYASNTYYH
jgi:hypothetical protein